MGLGIVKLANKILNRFGLVIKDRDQYEERLSKVNSIWLQKLDIASIIDIGASTGGYSSKARKIYPAAKIASFEPLPKSYHKLTERFKNDLNHKAYNFVLSDKSGELEFNESSNSGSSSILTMSKTHAEAYPHTAKNTAIKVKADTLDAVFDSLGLEGNILLKLDVQGAEALVLKGAEQTLSKVKVVFIETSFVELYKGQWLFDDLYSFMKKHDFHLAGVENVSQNLKDGSFLQMDAYFMKNA